MRDILAWVCILQAVLIIALVVIIYLQVKSRSRLFEDRDALFDCIAHRMVDTINRCFGEDNWHSCGNSECPICGNDSEVSDNE